MLGEQGRAGDRLRTSTGHAGHGNENVSKFCVSTARSLEPKPLWRRQKNGAPAATVAQFPEKAHAVRAPGTRAPKGVVDELLLRGNSAFRCCWPPHPERRGVSVVPTGFPDAATRAAPTMPLARRTAFRPECPVKDSALRWCLAPPGPTRIYLLLAKASSAVVPWWGSPLELFHRYSGESTRSATVPAGLVSPATHPVVGILLYVAWSSKSVLSISARSMSNTDEPACLFSAPVKPEREKSA